MTAMSRSTPASRPAHAAGAPGGAPQGAAGACAGARGSRAVVRAVILAAGKGSRLAQSGAPLPKPLAEVCGVPLAARVLRSAARAGIERATVVTGYRAAELEAELPRWAPPGLALDFVHNPRFEQPNGVSLALALAQGGRAAGEPFALLMADHLFAPERLRAACECFGATGRSLLAVEARERFQGDLADATRVRVELGRVRAIAKGLESYDAIDTGLFVLAPEGLASACAEAGPAPCLSDVMRVLAGRGALDALALEVGWWQDVDTPEDLARAERLLLQSLRKDTDGFMSRHVHRPVSLFLTRCLWRTGLSPHAVTAAALALGLGAGAAFAGGADLRHGLIGASLFQLQSIVDGTDGELARLLHKESRAGFWLDVGADNLTHIAVFAGIAAGQAASGVPGPWGWIGAAAVLGVAASFAAMAPLLARRAPSAGALAKLVGALSRRGFTWLLFPCALFGWLGGFVVCAAAGAWIYALAVIALRWRARAAEEPAAR